MSRSSSPLFLLSLLLSLLPARQSCLIEECAAMYSNRLRSDSTIMGVNARYCTLMGDYLQCMDETSKRCRGNIKFHILNTLLKRQLADFNCDQFPSTSPFDDEHRCTFLFESAHSNSRLRYCVLFGDPHLRTFDGQFQTCRNEGAWPLVDNSYFLIQVTNTPAIVDSPVTAVSQVLEFIHHIANESISQVTIIVKSLRDCTGQKRYEASIETSKLSATFVDGSTSSLGGHVQVELHNDFYAELRLHHISSRIRIRRSGSFLSVAVQMPEQVLYEQTEPDSDQMCVVGCGGVRRQSVPLKAMLVTPEMFARCHGISLFMDRRSALSNCSVAHLTDLFLDSCVFDLMLTGWTASIDGAYLAQNDIGHLYPPYQKHYATGRTDLAIYDYLANDLTAWTNCKSLLPASSSNQVYNNFLSLILSLLLLLNRH